MEDGGRSCGCGNARMRRGLWDGRDESVCVCVCMCVCVCVFERVRVACASRMISSKQFTCLYWKFSKATLSAPLDLINKFNGKH